MYFVSNLPDIEVATTADKVHIRVVVANGSASEVCIDQYYFTSNNGFTIYDVCDLCKSFLEGRNLIYCTCTVTATVQDENDEDVVDTESVTVFYEGMATGRDIEHVNDYFLVSSDKKIIYKEGKLDEFIGYAHVRSQGENAIHTANFIAVCRMNDDSVSRVVAQSSIDFGNIEIYTGSLQFTYSSILQAVKAVDANVSEIMSFRIELDNRVVSYIVSDSDTENMKFFYFKNEFGFRETLALPGSTKEVNDYSQSVAVSGHTRIKYDATVEQSFQFQSAALASFLEGSVTSLLLAKTLTIWYAVGIAKAIIVTESTWEKSNEINTVNSVKFTYKFTDDRLVKYYSGAITRVFNNVYDNTYG
jgi:hypothetical protein